MTTCRALFGYEGQTSVLKVVEKGGKYLNNNSIICNDLV